MWQLNEADSLWRERDCGEVKVTVVLNLSVLEQDGTLISNWSLREMIGSSA
jgi:hypothetical protein